VGFAAISVGVLLGGGMVAKLGVRKALFLFGILASATNSGYLALSIVGKSHFLLAAAVGIHNLCSCMAEAAFMAFLMSLCNKSFWPPNSHFSPAPRPLLDAPSARARAT
jgi:PAT family beta-lactamase induction signal transducer AmpG